MQGPLAALLLQTSIWETVGHGTVFTYAVLVILACFSILSLAIAFSKWSAFNVASRSDVRFLRAFRKASSIESVVAAAETFHPTPCVKIFDAGYAEAVRQLNIHRKLTNKDAVSRGLQIGISEQLTRFEHNLSWLATVASVSPFIGLFGTVVGIIRAFSQLGSAGSTSLSQVGPGISEALVATAVGLVAAIPAAIFYNVFGRRLKEMGDRFDNFSLEFMNVIEKFTGE